MLFAASIFEMDFIFSVKHIFGVVIEELITLSGRISNSISSAFFTSLLVASSFVHLTKKNEIVHKQESEGKC